MRSIAAAVAPPGLRRGGRAGAGAQETQGEGLQLRVRISWLALCVLLGIGCASYPRAPSLELHRADLAARDGRDRREVEPIHPEMRGELAPPLSGGLLWLHRPSVQLALTEPTRTGVLEAALDALRHEPFGSVAALPVIAQVSSVPPIRHAIAALRSGSAERQVDVALLLQTGAAEDRGFNPLAIAYLGFFTAYVFPGSDVAVSSSAELCAADVRTGRMLGCAHGSAQEMDRLLFVWQLDRARDRLVERTLQASVAAAAQDLLGQIAASIAARAQAAGGRQLGIEPDRRLPSRCGAVLRTPQRKRVHYVY